LDEKEVGPVGMVRFDQDERTRRKVDLLPAPDQRIGGMFEHGECNTRDGQLPHDTSFRGKSKQVPAIDGPVGGEQTEDPASPGAASTGIQQRGQVSLIGRSGIRAGDPFCTQGQVYEPFQANGEITSRKPLRVNEPGLKDIIQVGGVHFKSAWFYQGIPDTLLDLKPM
jgi:hypothetical protein